MDSVRRIQSVGDLKNEAKPRVAVVGSNPTRIHCTASYTNTRTYAHNPIMHAIRDKIGQGKSLDVYVGVFVRTMARLWLFFLSLRRKKPKERRRD